MSDGALMAGSELTLEAFLALPERDPPLEYIDGRVIEKPPLVGPESWLRADLAALLFGWARASRQGAAAAGVRCTLGGNSYVPDVVYFAPERVPTSVADAGVPDFAVEVCPSAVDPSWVAAKTAHYVAHGVRAAWMVDPTEETVTVYRPESAPTVLGRGALLEAEDVLPRFYLHVDDLFDVLQEEDEEHPTR